MNWDMLLNPAVLALLIPILAMVWWIIATILKHRERMAMIENGFNPDAPDEIRKQTSSSGQSPS